MSTRDDAPALRWRDTTIYSLGNVERTPSVWRLSVAGVTIAVHRHIAYAPDAWLLSCAPWFATRELASIDATQAKAEALDLVRGKLREACAAFGVSNGSP